MRELFHVLGDLLEHLTDRQLIGASCLADTALYAVAGLLRHGVVSVLGPVCQAVLSQIIYKVKKKV